MFGLLLAVSGCVVLGDDITPFEVINKTDVPVRIVFWNDEKTAKDYADLGPGEPLGLEHSNPGGVLKLPPISLPQTPLAHSEDPSAFESPVRAGKASTKTSSSNTPTKPTAKPPKNGSTVELEHPAEGGGARNRLDTLARVAEALDRHLIVSFPQKVPARLKDAVQVG